MATTTNRARNGEAALSNHYGLIELVLVFGALLGFLLWELRKTNREIERDKDKPPPP